MTITGKRLLLLAICGCLLLPGCSGRTVPRCHGDRGIAIDGVWDGSEFPSREAAAIHALHVAFGSGVDEVVLRPAGGNRYRIVEVDGRRIDHAPTVEVFAVGAGFAPGGVSC